MEYGGMNFVEAVNDLAARVGMQVPAQQPEPRSGPGEIGSSGWPQNQSRMTAALFGIWLRQ